MTDRQIADAQRASNPRRVVVIQPWDVTWDLFTVEEIRNLTRACGIDFTSRADINRVECYLRKNNHRPSFRYLTSDPNWKTHYLPMLLRWRSLMPNNIPTTLPLAIQKLLAKLPK